jgi:iron-sulfur cluster repair protein YtfE (RIC family)
MSTEDTTEGTETLAQALEREHREIDAGIEAFTAGGQDAAAAAEPMLAAIRALRRHIYLEEEFLFPPLRGAGMMMPVFVMVREHAEMWRLLDELEPRLAAGASPGGLAEACTQLVSLLQAHNPKEEQILYPPAEQTLGAQATGELRQFMRTGALPDGWTAEGLRTA